MRLPAWNLCKRPTVKFIAARAATANTFPGGTLKRATPLNFWEKLRFSLLEVLPHARRDISCQPVQAAKGETDLPGAAASVEAGRRRRQASGVAQRGDEHYGFQRIDTPQGALTVQFDVAEMPLGFSLKLLKFTRKLDPGGMGDAAYESSVQVEDEKNKIDA